MLKKTALSCAASPFAAIPGRQCHQQSPPPPPATPAPPASHSPFSFPPFPLAPHRPHSNSSQIFLT
ncbi:TPA: hypothetical protein MHS15_25145 [Klebsiella pneumoniae]|nr:hypothetical protein DKP79_12755 [Klebsiella pneumoniae]RBI73886.1 hypothetical protein DRZ75_10985 [Klebsiella pneumoniae]HBX2112962.1 hypothetical protein [Klebsiella pneumoniae]HBX2134559.1 hypothetical protein [Klebsiella pneumoniae]HBX2161804.1 hypothetical protein [Klebsiella pneumoniae]